MSTPELSLWWDKEVDHAGRPIRSDVRAVAHGIWSCACRRALELNSDSSQAADLMENTVAQVSRYLDRSGVGLFSREIGGLLMLAFQRALYRHSKKLTRLEPLGGTQELSSQVVDRNWARQVQAQLELEQIVRLLSHRSRTILALRYAGYTWKEAAGLLGFSVPALRSAFWRDVDSVREKLHLSRALPRESRDVARQDLRKL